jgi:hypothetical protein
MATLAQQRMARPSTTEEGSPSELTPSLAGDSDSGMSQALSELSLAGSQTRSVQGLGVPANVDLYFKIFLCTSTIPLESCAPYPPPSP